MSVIKTRVEPIDRDIRLAIADLAGPQRSSMIASFARQARDEAKAQNRNVLGRVPFYKTFVDGTEGADEDRVRPDGRIVYEFDLGNEVVAFIVDALGKFIKGPTGRYERSHIVLADGQEIKVGRSALPVAMEYIVISTVPYARKVERWHQVYEMVAQKARSRFRGARILFGHRALLGGGSLEKWARKTKMESGGHRAHQSSYSNWLRNQPAIMVTFK